MESIGLLVIMQRHDPQDIQLCSATALLVLIKHRLAHTGQLRFVISRSNLIHFSNEALLIDETACGIEVLVIKRVIAHLTLKIASPILIDLMHVARLQIGLSSCLPCCALKLVVPGEGGTGGSSSLVNALSFGMGLQGSHLHCSGLLLLHFNGKGVESSVVWSGSTDLTHAFMG